MPLQPNLGLCHYDLTEVVAVCAFKTVTQKQTADTVILFYRSPQPYDTAPIQTTVSVKPRTSANPCT